ncbi:unnamed protein product [Durusdinium trenchii]|uniref:Uncharacterized protein n=1 Tax=Durusdinium trenchii TaxID=1381693 RepID=A0ABP0KN00_9DINO
MPPPRQKCHNDQCQFLAAKNQEKMGSFCCKRCHLHFCGGTKKLKHGDLCEQLVAPEGAVTAPLVNPKQPLDPQVVGWAPKRKKEPQKRESWHSWLSEGAQSVNHKPSGIWLSLSTEERATRERATMRARERMLQLDLDRRRSPVPVTDHSSSQTTERPRSRSWSDRRDRSRSRRERWRDSRPRERSRSRTPLDLSKGSKRRPEGSRVHPWCNTSSSARSHESGRASSAGGHRNYNAAPPPEPHRTEKFDVFGQEMRGAQGTVSQASQPPWHSKSATSHWPQGKPGAQSTPGAQGKEVRRQVPAKKDSDSEYTYSEVGDCDKASLRESHSPWEYPEQWYDQPRSSGKVDPDRMEETPATEALEPEPKTGGLQRGRGATDKAEATHPKQAAKDLDRGESDDSSYSYSYSPSDAGRAQRCRSFSRESGEVSPLTGARTSAARATRPEERTPVLGAERSGQKERRAVLEARQGELKQTGGSGLGGL